MDGRNIEVVVDNLENNPHCLHGPTLLFRKFSGKIKEYFACSASRDHKSCNFYMPSNEKDEKNSTVFWKDQQKELVASINELNPYKKFIKILNALHNKADTSEENKKPKKEVQATYCYSCNSLFANTDNDKHLNCNVLKNLTYHHLTHPTEILIPKIDNKTHAQYFFSESSVKDISLLLTRLKVTKTLCIGVPRIHEHILNEHKNEVTSLLLDFDKNYYNFYSKNQFIWYNMFNNYIFDETQERILCEFLQGGRIVVLMDPPFGGRVEPLARTLNKLSETFSYVNNFKNKGASIQENKRTWIVQYRK